MKKLLFVLLLACALMLCLAACAGLTPTQTTTTASSTTTQTPTTATTQPSVGDGCPHVFSDWTIAKLPSCSEEGQMIRICAECMEQETLAIPPSPHTEAVTPAVAPTCTTDGKTEGKHCSECGEVLVAQTTIPAPGHTEVIDPAVDFTCTTDGKTEGKHCSTCGEVFIAQVKIDAHHIEVIDPAVEFTCNTDGWTEGKHCSECGTVLVPQTIILANCVDQNGDHKCDSCSTTIFSQGLAYTLSVDGTYYILSSKGTCTDTVIVIPPTYNNLPVKEIGREAFYVDLKIKSVIIPEGVTIIGNYAFASCNLEQVTIPDSVKTIGEGAFFGNELKEITIPAGVTTIGKRAFSLCLSLKSVTFTISDGWKRSIDFNEYEGTTISAVDLAAPATAAQYLTSTYIDYIWQLTPVSQGLAYTLSADGTYYILSGIGTCTDTEIVIPATYKGFPVIEIGAMAFADCTSLTSITIPAGVTTIGYAAFSGCTSLKSITIPDSVTSIGDAAFSACTSLTSITVESGNPVYHSAGNCVIKTASKTLVVGCKSSVIPTNGSVTSIDSWAFRGCTSLTSITIPDSVTSIGGYAFYYCTSLTSITIPSSVTSIGDYVFWYCRSLTSVTIPEGVTSIGDYAFSHCTALTSIAVDEKNSVYMSIDGNLYTKDGKTLIQYAVGKTATTFVIPDNVTSIGTYAFSNCDSLTSITIPNSVTSIGFQAFSGTSLTSVTIGDSVTSIGGYAFYYCTSLTSVTFENPNGWVRNGYSVSASDLADPATAARYLGYTYPSYTWTRD